MGSPWLTSAVAAAASAMEGLGLLEDVQHEAWIGADSYDKPVYDDPILLRGRVQEGSIQVRTVQGQEINVRACISFLSPISPNGASGRREPIDPRDRFTLASGYTGPIVENPGSEKKPVVLVWLK